MFWKLVFLSALIWIKFIELETISNRQLHEKIMHLFRIIFQFTSLSLLSEKKFMVHLSIVFFASSEDKLRIPYTVYHIPKYTSYKRKSWSNISNRHSGGVQILRVPFINLGTELYNEKIRNDYLKLFPQ